MSRQAYNKLQAEVRRQQAETLKLFKEQNPDAYERLLKRAQEELRAEELMSPIELLNLKRPVTRHVLTKEFSYNPQERHYLVHTKDEWGTDHLYFESFIPTPTTEEVLDELHRRHPNFSGQITSVEPCACPACLRRHNQ